MEILYVDIYKSETYSMPILLDNIFDYVVIVGGCSFISLSNNNNNNIYIF